MHQFLQTDSLRTAIGVHIQTVANGTDQQPPNQSPVIKTNFGFGRMHIDVHIPRIYVKKQRAQRITP